MKDNSMGVTKPNDQYDTAKHKVDAIRDAVAGEVVIKSPKRIKEHLPDPYPHLPDDLDKKARIKRYRMNAEFDDIPGDTLESLVGSIFRHDPTSNLPTALAYLEEDADGDGMTLTELLKAVTGELLQMNYVGMLAEYTDLSTLDLDVEEVTVAVQRQLGLQSSIKLYPRETIIDWNYRRVNGRVQLDYVVLHETEERKGLGDDRKTVHSWLVLYLDNDGYYTQRRFVREGEGDGVWSEPHQPQANSARMTEIPFEIATASLERPGVVPLKLGYISPIVSKSLHRFRISADYKESIWLNGAPVTKSSGWTDAAHQTYKNVNRIDYIPTGPGTHVALPEGVDYEIMSWDASTSAYESYLERNEREIRAIGGQFDTTDGADAETATAATINHAKETGTLSAVALSAEQAIRQVLKYVGAYMGVNEIPEDVVQINRDFATPVLSPQQRAQILNEWESGFIDAEEALAQYRRGGALVSEVDALLQRVHNGDSGDDLPLTPNDNGQENIDDETNV